MNHYKRIRELREDHDLTQREIAEILGMAQAQYQRYESGIHDIPTDNILCLRQSIAEEKYTEISARILEQYCENYANRKKLRS